METVFLKIMNMSITASWLVLAVILLRLLLKKAPKWLSGVLWVLVALRLIFPFSIESVFSLIPSAKTLPDNFIYTAEPFINSGIPLINFAVNPVLSESLTASPGDSANPTQILSFFFSAIWLMGLGIMLAYMVMSYIVLRFRLREGLRLEENVYLCDKVSSPFILGIIRPKIYMPSNICEENKKYVLAHERAHIKRLDYIWKPLGFILLSIYWFNPILWVAYILFCRDIELACDEKVIKGMGEANKKSYSLALIDCSAPRRMISACPLAFGEVGVKERVKRILNYKKPAFWIILVGLTAAAIAAVCLMTNPLSTITIEEIEEPFSMKGMLDGVEEISYNGNRETAVTDRSTIEDIVASLKGIRLKTKPLSRNDERCGHLSGSILIKRENGYVSLSVPGYGYSDDSRVFEQNIIRITVSNVGIGYDYAVVDSDILESIVDAIASPSDKKGYNNADNTANINKTLNESLNNIDIKDAVGGVTSFSFNFVSSTHREYMSAELDSYRWEALRKALSDSKYFESAEYSNISPLYTFNMGYREIGDIKLCFYNKESALITNQNDTADNNVFGLPHDVKSIDNAYINAYGKYYGIKEGESKKALIDLLVSLVEEGGSPFNRYYGAEKLVAVSSVLSDIPTAENTPAYYIERRIVGYDQENNSCIYKYYLRAYENHIEENEMAEDLWELNEMEYKSDEYNQIFPYALLYTTYFHDVDAPYSRDGINAYTVYDKLYYAYSKEKDTGYALAITHMNEIYLAVIPGFKSVSCVFRLKDITPCFHSKYIDHIFYDFNGDGIMEACTISKVASYDNHISIISIRSTENGAVLYNSEILTDAEMNMVFATSDGELKVRSKETESGREHIYDVSLGDYILDPEVLTTCQIIILSEDGKALSSTPMMPFRENLTDYKDAAFEN